MTLRVVPEGLAAACSGVAALDSDDYGGGPSVPMLPHTWTPEEGRDN